MRARRTTTAFVHSLSRRTACSEALRICSSSGDERQPERLDGVVLGGRRRCPGSSSIVTWSAVSGAPGSHSVRRAPVRATRAGTWTSAAALAEPLRDPQVELVQVTLSGPPSSKVRFAASGRSSAAAKYAATSSTQIGCERWRPAPITVTTGESRTCRTNVGSTPPSRPNTKLGRKITCSSPDARDVCLHLPLRGEVRRQRLASARPCRARSSARAAGRPPRAPRRARCAKPSTITRSKSAGPAADDRDEVHDVRAARAARREARRVGDVAGRELGAPARELARRARAAHERAHVGFCARSACTISARRSPCRR